MLPWRDTNSPYEILVSEVMLQQTQVARVMPIYRGFILKFPSLPILGKTTLADVVRAWGPLGYNVRAVRLHRAANIMIREYNNTVPDDLNSLLKLPGIGPYTAAAIANFAFGHSVPVVDTNIARVISRVFNGIIPMSSTDILETAHELLHHEPIKTASGDWHQALMDLGAMICSNTKPKCTVCPLQSLCAASPILAVPSSKLAAWESVPNRITQSKYQGSNRYYRGRIIEILRRTRGADGIPAKNVGPAIAKDYRHQSDWEWLNKILQSLRKDSLVAMREQNGVVMVTISEHSQGTIDMSG
jgi:A/G-specific adenine glycosylase